MAYATRDDLVTRYGADEIEQRESVLPAGAVAQALADADAVIEGYMVGLYRLPLSPAPANLAQVACAIARYHLLGDAVTERARYDYKDAIDWLKDVRGGRVQLQGAAPVPANEPAAVVMYAGSPSVFKRAGRP